MKSVLLILVLIASGTSTHAQYVSITKENNGTNSLIVPSGEYWQLVSAAIFHNSRSTLPFYSSTNANDNTYLGSIPATSGNFVSMEAAASYSPWASFGAVIPGPAYLKYLDGCTSFCLTFKKLSSGSANSISATSVVIPSTAAGDVDVKLEQSADNVTWTECLPGTYNSSTVKRFFRLRAVEK